MYDLTRAAALTLVLCALPAVAEESERMAPVTDAKTLAECSACHMAYPAGFLPARSWKAIMAGLESHFGENAQLDETSRAEIEVWLVANAAGERIRGVAADATPLRISELPWFVRGHKGEVSAARLARAGSMANCATCHEGAERGTFGDD